MLSDGEADMNLQEVAAVLAKIQIIDKRQVDELVLQEWAHILDGLEFQDCVAAVVEHRRTSTDYLLPVHVVQGAKRAAAERRKSERRYLLELVANAIQAGQLEGHIEDYETGYRKIPASMKQKTRLEVIKERDTQWQK